MRSLPPLLLCLLELACNPGFDLDSFGSSRLAVGARCRASTECASGICSDQVCCSETCEATATCAMAGKEGSCTQRSIGAICSSTAPCAKAADGSDVPCVDGVCCESACEGLCQSCAVPGHLGECREAPDNTDARGQCDECWACYSGSCAPAVVGTDPKGACAAEGAAQGLALTCSAKQTCAPKLGSACATTADCAMGECIGDRCLLGEVESVFVFPMRQASTGRYVGGATVDVSGALSLLFTEEHTALSVDCSSCSTTNCSQFDSCASTSIDLVLDRSLGIAKRSVDGTWKGRLVFTDTSFWGPIPAAIVSLGRWQYVVSYSFGASSKGGENCDAVSSSSSREVDSMAVPCGIFRWQFAT